MIVYQITLGSSRSCSTQPHNTVAAEKHNTVPTQDRGRPREEARAHLPDGEKDEGCGGRAGGRVAHARSAPTARLVALT
jgi:hypothetical protein